MQSELDILRDITKRFDEAGFDYMLTGSIALNYYAEPRMTRDIDIVVTRPNASTVFLRFALSADRMSALLNQIVSASCTRRVCSCV
jgi:hypothetical protein